MNISSPPGIGATEGARPRAQAPGPSSGGVNDLARLAALACQTPFAFVVRQNAAVTEIMGQSGWDASVPPPDLALCRRNLQEGCPLVIPDTTLDPLSAADPIVTSEPGVRFYAGVHIGTADRTPIGVLCVLDCQPREITPGQTEALRLLAAQAFSALELQRTMAEIAEKQRLAEFLLRRSDAFHVSLVESLPQSIFRKDLSGRFTFVNRRFCMTLGRQRAEILGRSDLDLFPRELAEKYQRDDQTVIDSTEMLETVEANRRPNGETHFEQVVKTPL